MNRDDGYLSDFYPVNIVCKRCRNDVADEEHIMSRERRGGEDVIRILLVNIFKVYRLLLHKQ